MKSKVYYIPIDQKDSLLVIQEKLKQLIQASKAFGVIYPQDKVVLKIHFGEEGNTGYVKSEYARVICEEVLSKSARPILADTNTLYRGRRTNSADHLKIAAEHGFTKENTKAEIVIPEDKEDNVRDVAVNQKFIQVAKVSKLFLEADILIDVAHFKGHLMTGFGGALKNIGMGCASREGKLAQHSDVSPLVYESKCIGCGACVDVCPVDAISLIDNKSVIDGKTCIGCASCIAACSYGAIDVNWESGSQHMQEKMIEYAKAVLANKKDKLICINFAVKITKECDCLAKDDPRICPDIGIFLSADPVSVDKACYDKVLDSCRKDIFKEAHPKREGMKQLQYASSLGLGNLDYELIRI